MLNAKMGFVPIAQKAQELTMTQVQTKTKRLRCSPPERPDPMRRSAEQILREAAFVLQMTRRVRDAIRAEQKSPSDGSWC